MQNQQSGGGAADEQQTAALVPSNPPSTLAYQLGDESVVQFRNFQMGQICAGCGKMGEHFAPGRSLCVKCCADPGAGRPSPDDVALMRAAMEEKQMAMRMGGNLTREQFVAAFPQRQQHQGVAAQAQAQPAARHGVHPPVVAQLQLGERDELYSSLLRGGISAHAEHVQLADGRTFHNVVARYWCARCQKPGTCCAATGRHCINCCGPRCHGGGGNSGAGGSAAIGH